MDFISQLSAAGKCAHRDALDIENLKTSHLDCHRTKISMDWNDVYLITWLRSATSKYKTAIFFKTEKITGCAVTIPTLIKKLVADYSTDYDYSREDLAHFLNVFEYIPFPHGELGFIPLKNPQKSNQVTWLAADQIETIQPIENGKATYVFFKDIETPVKLPITKYFLNQRIKTLKNIDHLIDVLQNGYTDLCREIKQAFKSFVSVTRQKKIMTECGMPITEDMIIEHCKKELGFYYKPGLGYQSLLKRDKEFDLD